MRKSLILTAMLLVLAVSPVHAIDIQNFQPAIGTQNLLTLYSSDNYKQGQFGFAFMANYAADPLVFTFPDSELKVVESMATEELQGAVGVFDFIELGVAGSLSTVSGKDMNKPLTPDFPDTGMQTDSGPGDVRAAIKFRILENKPGSIGMALVPYASFPSGTPDTFSGAGAFNAGGRLVLDKRFDRVNIVFNGGYVYMGDPDEADKGFEPAGRAEFGAGVSIFAHKYVELVAEIFGRTVDYGIEELDPQTPAEAVGAMKLYAGPVNFVVGGGAGVNSGIGNPKARGFAGIALTIPKQKRGAPVPSQLVPQPVQDPKKMDRDRDGLVDYDETEVTHTDPLNADTDGDGLKDGEEVRKTRTDPLKEDTDGDGLSDFEEVKVYFTDPRKKDTDGDTLSDGAEVKQYRTSPLDPDTDHDGVPDNLDGAPLEPETINGILDWDGIPEVIFAKKPSGVTLTDSVIWLPTKLTFAGPKGDQVGKNDKVLLKDVAGLMKEYPNIKIEVQGHVAPGKDKASDAALTTQRARVVAQTLIQMGVKSDRITFKGYGGDFPVKSNSTPEGRAFNERIDLVITEK